MKNKNNKRDFLIFFMLFVVLIGLSISSTNRVLAAESVPFPRLEVRPSPEDYLPIPMHIYYCSPSGDNITGDGSMENPWQDLRGADGSIIGGDLIYLRGGTYPDTTLVNFSYSDNRLQNNGFNGNYIVITNYPGEIARWENNSAWSLTLDGDYQVLIGSMVGEEYGIYINGGITVRGNNCMVHNVDFEGGAANGGDKNPAMVEFIPRDINITDVILSHNYFHDDIYIPEYSGDWLAAIRSFQNTNLVIEYNIFENLDNLFRGAIDFKDLAHDNIVRYNKFISVEKGVSYCTQGDGCDGLLIYENLMKSVDNPFYFSNDLSPSNPIRFFKNVCLDIGSEFFYYLNSDNQDWSVHGEFYDNVIDGVGFAVGWADTSSDPKNLPDFFDYNLWKSPFDMNQPWGDRGYHSHSVVSADLGILYDALSMTAIADSGYAGRFAGRYGGNIGGFEFSEITESCSDNIQNQDETGIDCGGVCDACIIPTTYTLTNFISAITNWLGVGNETSDVNSDGVVNTRDLGIIMSNELN